VAQLTLDLSTRDVKLQINEENSDLNNETGVFKPSSEVEQYMEDESILHKDGPKFAEGNFDKDLGEADLILIAAQVNYVLKTMPKDEHREELLRPFVLALTRS